MLLLVTALLLMAGALPLFHGYRPVAGQTPAPRIQRRGRPIRRDAPAASR
ncbi:hypothetical protein [Methylobacterium crusticola]|nr:hypothetical protein [Methylobacterium crusticola]